MVLNLIAIAFQLITAASAQARTYYEPPVKCGPVNSQDRGRH